MNSSTDTGAVCTQTYDPAYFATIAEVERQHFWFQTRNAMVGDLVKSAVAGMGPGCRVLEVGCGTGGLLCILESVCTGGTVTGMDLYPEALEFARQRTSCRLEFGDIREMVFEERFHVVCMCDVLEHLPDDETVLRRLRDMILPEGMLVLTVPAFPSLWSYFDEVSHHCRRYSSASLRQTLRHAGFTVDYISHYMGVLLPVAYVVRCLRGLWHRRPGNIGQSGNRLVSHELRVSPVMNGLFGILLRLEHPLIRRRVKLRFGTSLVAIARRNRE